MQRLFATTAALVLLFNSIGQTYADPGAGADVHAPKIPPKTKITLEPTAAPKVRLEYGRGLITFQPELRLSRQTPQVSVRGWHPREKVPSRLERAPLR